MTVSHSDEYFDGPCGVYYSHGFNKMMILTNKIFQVVAVESVNEDAISLYTYSVEMDDFNENLCTLNKDLKLEYWSDF